jgi:hypothetical protein
VGTPQNALAGSPEILSQFPHFLNIGYCTQIAIFTRSLPRAIIDTTPSWGTLEVIINLQYPANMLTTYPPSSETIASSIGDLWRQFRPDYNARHKRGFIASAMARIVNGDYHESQDVLVCQIPLEKLYDMNYNLQKLCHFNKGVFEQVAQDLDGQSFDRGTFLLWSSLIPEFVGMEVGRGSLRSFRFVLDNPGIHVLYEYSRYSPGS